MLLKDPHGRQHASVCIAAVLILFALAAGLQPDVATSDQAVLGAKTWQQWQAEAGWSSHHEDDFQPSEAKVRTIAEVARAKNVSFVVFGGSWCKDTQAQFPMIFKIFERASIGQEKIQLFGVDRQKEEPSGAAGKFGIRKVPTVIVFASGREIGRITEYPETTWEDDLMKILSQ